MVIYCKKLVNVPLKLFGVKLCKVKEDYVHPMTYLRLIKEVESYLTELIFPELKPCDHRAELMAKLLGISVGTAMYLIGYLNQSLKVDGDVCEFGIAQGATSALLANEIRRTEKNIWLFDSFKGLSKPSKRDVLLNDILNLGAMDKYEGQMACHVGQVIARLRDISFPITRVKIIPGFVEDTLKLSKISDKVCFAFIDCDLYSPTLEVLNYLDKHLSPGGIIVVHDYGFFSLGVKTAVDKFVKGHCDSYSMNIPNSFAGPISVLHKQN